MLLNLKNELKKLARPDVYVLILVYVFLTSLLFFLAFFENGFLMETKKLAYYFKWIIKGFTFFLFTVFVILSIGKELSNQAFTTQILFSKNLKSYMFIKYNLIVALSFFIILFEILRLLLIAFLIDTELVSLFSEIDSHYIFKLWVSFVYIGIGGMLLILIFKKSTTSVIILYFYVQIEMVLVHPILAEKMGFNLFGYFPTQVEHTFLNGSGWAEIGALCIIAGYMVLFFFFSKKRILSLF